MPTCSFCKKHYNFPRGLTVFLFDGKSLHFCSSKCKRNLKLKRDPRKVNWVKKAEKISKKQKQIEKFAKIKEENDEKISEVKKSLKKEKQVEKIEKKPEKSSEIKEKVEEKK